MYASGNGYYSIVKYLINHNANLNATANDGDTALSIAKRNKHQNIVDLLIQMDAHIQPSLHSDSLNSTSCERGFAKTGGECLPVKIPYGAKLNSSGNDWECKNGYEHQGDSCVWGKSKD